MLQEQNIYGLWAGKQTAKGTAQDTPGRRFVQGTGDFDIARDDGSMPFSDLSKYGGRIDYPNNMTGVGEPVIAGTPTELAWILWAYHGAETVTAIPGPPAASQRTVVPATGLGHWTTWYKRKGLTVIDRERYIDCLIGRLQIEASSADKVVRITPRILSLDPGQTRSADPVAGMPTGTAFLYSDGTSTFTIDGVVVKAHSSFTFVIDEDLQPVYADDVVVHDFATGAPAVTIGVTLQMDADAKARYNKLVYDNPTPAADTKPIRRIPALGSYTFDLKQKDTAGALNGKEFKITIPGVKWAVPDRPPPNPAGGPSELTFAGEMRPTGSPAYTIDTYIDSGVPAFTT